MSGSAAPPNLTVFSNGIGVVADATLNGFVQGGALIADLRNFVGLSNMTVELIGTSTPGDGGQGSFYWNPASTTADDDGVTCVAPYSVVIGRWLRLSGGSSGAGSVTALPNIAALRALTSPPSSTVVVDGYYAGSDGGGGVYWHNAASSSPDNGGSVIVDGGGDVWELLTFGAPFSARQFGAKGDATTDDSVALQAMLTAAGAGGQCFCPAGTYRITTLLTMAANDLSLQGAGAGDLHDTGTNIVAPCRFVWDGALGGTMLKIQSGTTQYPAGNKFGGIFLDGNSGQAAIGLQIMSGRLGTYEVVGAHCTVSLVQLDIDTALSEPAGVTENLFTRISGYQTNNGDGALLTENGTASFDCSQNTFQLISGDFLNGPCVNIVNADSETFQVIKLFQVGGGSDVGVSLHAGPAPGQCARNNMFWYVGVSSSNPPVFAAGTSFGTSPSAENNIVFLDTANNPNAPSVDTDATLWWGTVRAPTGYRDFTLGVNVENTTDTGGMITESGITGTIAASGTATVTLTTPFTTGVTAINVAPETPVVWAADCSTTTLLIVNGDTATASVFRWEVRGF